jgi:hypothetical protein
MDAESMLEVRMHVAMWRLEAKRQKKEDKALERKTKSHGH